jgi:hypothetical protein
MLWWCRSSPSYSASINYLFTAIFSDNYIFLPSHTATILNAWHISCSTLIRLNIILLRISCIAVISSFFINCLLHSWIRWKILRIYVFDSLRNTIIINHLMSDSQILCLTARSKILLKFLRDAILILKNSLIRYIHIDQVIIMLLNLLI